MLRRLTELLSSLGGENALRFDDVCDRLFLGPPDAVVFSPVLAALLAFVIDCASCDYFLVKT